MKETETMIKRVIPYLARRGYEIENNMFFEELVKSKDKAMFLDILIKKSKTSTKSLFLIEVKRDTLKLEQKHINQAIKYGEGSSIPFVVITNGLEFRMYNVKNKKRISFNGMMLSKIPSYGTIETVLKHFKNNPELDDITLNDNSLPYKPTVSASQLEELLKRCHNIIRNVEKDETHIFSDLSKLIFLKLLEEKKDAGKLSEDIPFPLVKSFHELAKEKNNELVMQTIRNAISQIFTHRKFKDLAPIASGDEEAAGHEGVAYKALLYTKNKSTYTKLVKELSKVHFMDAEIDVKGSVFEYFIRSTLQGRKGLGQYFTPRPIIQLMCEVANIRKLLKRMSLTGATPKVVDPACGSGGFLIYSLSTLLKYLEEDYKGSLTTVEYQDLVKRVKEQMFFGQDANQSIVVAAKMNMIIAGDGSSNIFQGNTLAFDNKDKLSKPNLIITNPPFGSTESDSLDENDLDKYDIKITTAQGLFIQHMINAVAEEGEVITIIDESILNAPKWKRVREFIMNKSCIEAIISLPKAAFSPNRINVKTSIFYLKKKKGTDPEDYIQDYAIRMIELNAIGYNKKGDIISPAMSEIVKVIKNRWDEIQHSPLSLEDTGELFSSYPLTVKNIHSQYNPSLRLDYKFHNPDILNSIQELKKTDRARPLFEFCVPTNPDEYKKAKGKNNIPVFFKRGKTPNKAHYNVVGATVRMIKAGNIGKTGSQEGAGIDYVTEDLANTLQPYRAKKNDILLASTGEGTLGKSMVVKGELIGGLVDGHVTIIRLKDNASLLPEFVVWFLRSNLGQSQIERLYMGSTGQIELTERDIEDIVVPCPTIEIQKAYINRCRGLVLKAVKLRQAAEKAISKLNHYKF